MAGRGAPAPGAPVNVPVVFSSTYRAEGEIAYGRDDNQVWAALEEVIGALEGGSALTFASGMAAVSAVIETLPAGATVVVPRDAYSGTRRLVGDLAVRNRVLGRATDIADTDATLEACRGAALLWVESPTNPLMAVADISALARGAHRLGVPVVVDNTFATPLLQRPLDLGADVVVHSASKYLAGHSDVVMGAVVTRDPSWLDALGLRRSLHGGIAGPMEAFLTLRGVRTLPVRLERAQANAAELASRLASHPLVEGVLYPGLESHPGHRLAASQMGGFGAMLSFEVAGRAFADAVCAAVRLCVPGTSLGGVETLIERRQRWAGEEALPEGLIRLSVGIEHVDDLWGDLSGALSAASASAAG